jgi:hypothetical protein
MTLNWAPLRDVGSGSGHPTSSLSAFMNVGKGDDATYLEKRLRIRPVGVVSKKLIGALKIAKAILSWSFREA